MLLRFFRFIRIIPALFLVAAAPVAAVTVSSTDNYMFIHHSSGGHWLVNSLRDALRAKSYVHQFNDIGYTTDVPLDDGRPDSLTLSDGLVPGDHTDMCHWVRWFNDYLGRIKTHGSATGVNRIVMFKSCYPNSNVGPESPPGDPFSEERNLSNYKAIFRHPDGPGHTYTFNGATYRPLEDVFAQNPDTLFIYVTAPPLLPSSTNADHAARAREFNNWVKTAWLDSYNAAHPGLNNVVVFDWFNVLAVPEGQTNAHMIRPDYASSPTDNHPNDAANAYSTQLFATNNPNFLDTAYQRFTTASSTSTPPPPSLPGDPDPGNSLAVFPNPYRPGSGGSYDDTAFGKGIVFSGVSDRTRIRIFSVTGEPVADVTVTGTSGRYLWDATDRDGSSVASGVYLYLLTPANGGSATKGKIAILR